MCGSLITGATFALFTSKSETNIAITSGKVSVTATVDNGSINMYSATTDSKSSDGEDYDPITNAGDLGEFSGTYYYKPITYDTKNNSGTFTNGGTVELKENTITLDKITAGDKVSFSINVKNESNVAVQYRTVISCSGDKTLFLGLNFTVDETSFSQVSLYKSAYVLAKDSEEQTINISVELPLDAGKAYQNGKSTTITYAIEAVQGNADTSSGSQAYYEYAPVGAEGINLTSDNLTYLDSDGEVTTDKAKATGIQLTANNVDTTAEEVVIPSNIGGVAVTEVGAEAFQMNNNITSVTIPSSVKSIDYNAFGACENLSNVQLSEGLEKIGIGAFYYCENLETIEIPSTVKVIEDGAFMGTNLTSINLPEGIQKIEGKALASDNDNFTIYYAGTKDQWGKILIPNLNYEKGKDDPEKEYITIEQDAENVVEELPINGFTTLFLHHIGGGGTQYIKNITIYFESTGEDDTKDKKVVKYTLQQSKLDPDISYYIQTTDNNE
jgi:predicted ribosomally synthesized peptide with SipW-like signal peptide